jgi:hypothetical protein
MPSIGKVIVLLAGDSVLFMATVYHKIMFGCVESRAMYGLNEPGFAGVCPMDIQPIGTVSV